MFLECIVVVVAYSVCVRTLCSSLRVVQFFGSVFILLFSLCVVVFVVGV